MRYVFALLFLIPLASYAQQNHTSAYIHVFNVLDSLPVPPAIKEKMDVKYDSTAYVLTLKEKEYKKMYKDKNVIKKKLELDKSAADADNLKIKRKLMQRFYASYVSAATLQIYDKGKKYESVMNADSPSFAKLPDNSFDVTAECLKLVREALEKSGER